MESNMQKMREALNRIGNIAVFVSANCGDQETAKYMTDMIMEVQSAVALPPRNCDFGTAEEQYRRWTYFCKFRNESRKTCFGCPVYVEQNKGQNSTCELIWAQMPYEAHADKGRRAISGAEQGEAE